MMIIKGHLILLNLKYSILNVVTMLNVLNNIIDRTTLHMING